jgi:hypothetical protein
VILYSFFPGCQQNSINNFKVKNVIPRGRPAVPFKENSRSEGVFIVIPEQLISVCSLLVKDTGQNILVTAHLGAESKGP